MKDHLRLILSQEEIEEIQKEIDEFPDDDPSEYVERSDEPMLLEDILRNDHLAMEVGMYPWPPQHR